MTKLQTKESCARCGGHRNLRLVSIEPRPIAPCVGFPEGRERPKPTKGYLCLFCRKKARGGWRYIR